MRENKIRGIRRVSALAAGLMAVGALVLPATAGADPSGTRSATGELGQTLTVTPANELDPEGTTVHVVGTGYNVEMGMYLALCVDNGPDLAPGPCFGGAAMSGGGGGSYWISSNPPSYAIGLTEPYNEDGSFEFDLHIVATDENTDCFDPETTCVVATRADHLNGADRSADVKVPVFFVGQEAPVDETTTTTSTTTSTTTTQVQADTTNGQNDDPTDNGDVAGINDNAGNNAGTSTSTGTSNESALAYTGARTNWLAGIGLALVALGLTVGSTGARLNRRTAENVAEHFE